MRVMNNADHKDKPHGAKWVASWSAAMQGPAPHGVPAALPDQSMALPNWEAHDQTFRMIIKPDLWGHTGRLRFSNAFGNRPVTLGSVRVAIHAGAGALIPKTTVLVNFSGEDQCTLEIGTELLSDPFSLPSIAADPQLLGCKLAVSFHVKGTSGALTWHAKAMTTSYISPPGSGAVGDHESEDKFPFSTTAWYFLDGMDVVTANSTTVVAALGDSITDGTFSTLNGDDRWSDRLSRRLHLAYGSSVSVVNVGIGGNQIIGPSTYPPPFNGGPSALDRLERDVLSRAGITHVIWAEGINDLGQAFAPAGTIPAKATEIIAGIKTGVDRMKQAGIKVIGGTLPTSLNATREIYGTSTTDTQRREINSFIRNSGIFDGIVDFEAATIDPSSGEFREIYQPDSTLGLPADRLHPNRAGYIAMGDAVDLDMFAPLET